MGPSSPWDPLTSEGAVAAQDAEAAGLAGTGAPRKDTRRAGRGHCGRGLLCAAGAARAARACCAGAVGSLGGRGRARGLLRGRVARARTLPCEAPGVSRARDCTPHPHPISATLAGSSEDSFQSKGIKSKENAHITALL